MRSAKIFAAITAAPLAGVTHIIEEGRFGGLSALMYAVHGFRVTSLEFLPLSGSTNGLKQLSPSVQLIDGDGAILLPKLLEHISPAEAAKTMVIFDGEKRFGAYKTFLRIRSKVALAVFDDTSINDGPQFLKSMTEKGEVWWDTTNPSFAPYLQREEAALTPLKPLDKFPVLARRHQPALEVPFCYCERRRVGLMNVSSDRNMHTARARTGRARVSL